MVTNNNSGVQDNGRPQGMPFLLRQKCHREGAGRIAGRYFFFQNGEGKRLTYT